MISIKYLFYIRMNTSFTEYNTYLKMRTCGIACTKYSCCNDGLTGPTGPIGPIGLLGPAGPTGLIYTGVTGSTGQAFTGLAG